MMFQQAGRPCYKSPLHRRMSEHARAASNNIYTPRATRTHEEILQKPIFKANHRLIRFENSQNRSKLASFIIEGEDRFNKK